jgi:hypothetical protein
VKELDGGIVEGADDGDDVLEGLEEGRIISFGNGM